MKCAVVLVILASAQAISINREAGWGPPTTSPPTPPPTTAGWSSTAPPTQPPTTAGWSSTAPPTQPPTTAGWSSTAPPTQPPTQPPTTSGWGPSPSHVNVNLDGAASVSGSGWAAENHQENVHVVGGGWTPAEISLNAGGDSIIDQHGTITQVTSIDHENASGVNIVGVSQLVDASEGMNLVANGLEALASQSGWAGSTGEGHIASAAENHIQANYHH